MRTLIFSDDSFLANHLFDFLQTNSPDVSAINLQNYSREIPFASQVFLVEGFAENFSKTKTSQISEKLSKALLHVKSTKAKAVIVIPRKEVLLGKIIKEYLSLWDLKISVIALGEINDIDSALRKITGSKKLPAPARKRKPVDKKKIKLGALALLVTSFLFLVPFFVTAVASIILAGGIYQLSNGNVDAGGKFFVVASKISQANLTVLKPLSQTIIVGDFFDLAYDSSAVIERTSTLGKKGVVFLNSLSEFSGKILGDENYIVSEYSEKFSVELENLFNEISFFETQLNTIPVIGKKMSQQKEKIKTVKNLLDAGRRISLRLPEILGQDAPRTYLILLQNNMELRPTGGFIGSFALVTFNKGVLADLSVMDVYSADGQLKGHVEPPAPIKDYLGEANWYLRDSNWDPDFVVSAQRAEWFLEKEIDRHVDGVVGIDLALLEKILKVTGPVEIDGFDEQVDAKNFYQKIQYEVEEEFFPGSRKKENFLSGLMTSLVNEVRHIGIVPNKKKDYTNLAKAVWESLDERSIQIYLHDKPAQAAVSDISYAGQLPSKGNWGGFVEANLGVNKANYFVRRDIKLDVFTTGDYIQNFMEVTFSNSSVATSGLKGRYKVYLRVLAPQGAQFSDSSETLVEIAPGEQKTISFSWTSPKDGDNYLWRKQAGVGGEQATLNLTVDGISKYNGPLNRDITWTK